MAKISITNLSTIKEYVGRIDSEFYTPDSMNADNLIKSHNYKYLGSIINDGYRVVYENTKILSKDVVDINNDARFLQATNISSDGLSINIENIGFVKKEDWSRYPKGRVKHGEILIEVKGQAEKVTIVQEYMPLKTLVTGTLFKLTLKKESISSEYLFAFFSCKYGKILRDRTKVNTLIAYVSKPELYKIPIPILSIDEHDEITKLVKISFELTNIANLKYRQALDLLYDSLKINKLKIKTAKKYSASFSEVLANGRSDADYYQPKYRALEYFLDTIMCKKISNMYSVCKGIEVGSKSYTKTGVLFARVSNISVDSIRTGNSDKYISTLLYQSLHSFQLNRGDILLTKDGTIGTCLVVDEDIKGVISGGIVKLIPLDGNIIPKEYIALVINSKIGKMQAERDCSGALISHWKPEQIRSFKIPILEDDIMSKIASLVLASKDARQRSKLLLEQAKNKIEQLIEVTVEK